MDQIIANSILNNDLKIEIIIVDISDHFPIAYAFKVKGTSRPEEFKEKYSNLIELLTKAP